MSRRLQTFVIALCAMLAVTGCTGSLPGAKDELKRMAALEIVTTVPPYSVQAAYDEDAGINGNWGSTPPVVTAVYASSGTVPEVQDFYVTNFGEYGFGEACCAPDDALRLEGEFAPPGAHTTYAEITISLDAPAYPADGGPPIPPAYAGADVYVIVHVFAFPPEA